MRLSSAYQPTTLDGIVGQPAIVRRLKKLVANPSPCCILLEGRGGVGKSATAKALIADLDVCPFSGVVETCGSNLSIEEVRRLFGTSFRLRPMFGSPWHVLLIEELELLPSRNVSAALKNELSEQNLPPKLIVVATSNDASGLDEALLQRFDIFPFGSGNVFAEACLDRLHGIWAEVVGPEVPMPSVVANGGWHGDHFSMRRALNTLSAIAESQRKEVAA